MKKVLRVTVVLLALLVLLMISTEPAKLPSLVLIIPFVLLFGVLSLCIAGLLAVYNKKISPRTLRIGALSASLPVFLLILQSIGQLTAKDTLIILLLFGLGYFYIARALQPISS